jgi:hypothetical protein
VSLGPLPQIAAALSLLAAVAAERAAGGQSLRVAPSAAQVEWTVWQGDNKLLVYRGDPRQFKPYVKELCTIRGDNLLRDAPSDHLHHHGLMYALRVNGLNFWEETSGNGVEKPIETLVSDSQDSPAGLPRATIRQTIYWLAPQDAFLPDSPNLALLIETRILLLTVDQSQEEVTLRWTSRFEVGGKTNTVVLDGASYFGLGARFLEELDPIAAHFNSDASPDLTGTKQDVSPHDWCAVAFDRPSAPATFAIFGAPANARGKTFFFTMKRPFAYISATQAVNQQPLVYHAGDKFQVDYLVAVYPAVQPRSFLSARAAEWEKTQP